MIVCIGWCGDALALFVYCYCPEGTEVRDKKYPVLIQFYIHLTNALKESYQLPVAEGSYKLPVAEGSYQLPVAERSYKLPVAEGSYQLPFAEGSYQLPVAEGSYQLCHYQVNFIT